MWRKRKKKNHFSSRQSFPEKKFKFKIKIESRVTVKFVTEKFLTDYPKKKPWSFKVT